MGQICIKMLYVFVCLNNSQTRSTNLNDKHDYHYRIYNECTKSLLAAGLFRRVNAKREIGRGLQKCVAPRHFLRRSEDSSPCKCVHKLPNFGRRCKHAQPQLLPRHKMFRSVVTQQSHGPPHLSLLAFRLPISCRPPQYIHLLVQR